MSVVQQIPVTIYVGNSSTTVFAVGFNITEVNDLFVTVNDIEPLIGTWAYAVGAVTFDVAPTTGAKIVFQRKTPLVRTTDFGSYSGYLRSEVLNAEFDKPWLVLQELKAIVDRALVLKVGDARNPIEVLQELQNWLEAAKNLATDLALPQLATLTASVATLFSSDLTINGRLDQAFADIGAILNNALAYRTLAELLLDTGRVANTAGYVTNDPTPANNGLYQWNGTNWLKSIYDPLAQALAAIAVAVAERKTVIDGVTIDGILLLESNFVVAQIAKDLFNVIGLPIIRNNAGVAEFVQDGSLIGRLSNAYAEWGGVKHLNNLIQFAGGTTLEHTDQDALLVTAEGFVLFDSRDAQGGSGGGTTPVDNTPVDTSKPFFGQTLCAWPSEEVSIYPANLTVNRVNQNQTKGILTTVASKTTAYNRSSRDQVVVQPDQLGATAQLVLRDTRQSDVRTVQDLDVKIVQAGAAQAPKILLIGDSIIHGAHAPDILNPILVAGGYAPVWIGTMTTAGGRKAEAHSGIETTDWTHRDSSKYAPVAVGGEAAYLASPSPNSFNPCIRASTGGDPAQNIFNGHIYDAAFYLSRFSLGTPDVIYINLGTNNIRDRNEPTLSTNFYDDMRIILDSWRAAAPNAQIILDLAPTAASADRDALWFKYAGLIAQLKKLVADRADPKLKICPSWAMVCTDAGYPLSTGTPDTLGALTVGLSDSIHPAAGSRQQLWQTVSAWLACAAKNYI